MASQQVARSANSEAERLAIIIGALNELNRENAPVKVTTLLVDRLRRIHMGGEMSPVSSVSYAQYSLRSKSLSPAATSAAARGLELPTS